MGLAGEGCHAAVVVVIAGKGTVAALQYFQLFDLDHWHKPALLPPLHCSVVMPCASADAHTDCRSYSVFNTALPDAIKALYKLHSW